MRRGQEPARGSWSLPGGLVELGETLEEAISRELAEETGLRVVILGVAAVLERISGPGRGPGASPIITWLVDFLCDWAGGEPAPGSDITAAQFVAPGDLAKFDLPAFTADVIRRAREQKRQGSFLPLLT